MILEHYEWGDPAAPPVICIHGVGSEARSWNRIARKRWGLKFRVIAFDLRGHGRSGWEPPWTHATYTADLLESIDALGIGDADWVGYSFGGRLLLDLAAQAPERINRAALLEPVIQIPPELALRRAQEELSGDVWDSLDAFLEGHGVVEQVSEEYAAEAAQQFDTLADGRIRRRTCQPAIVSIFSEFASPSPPPETLSMPAMLLYAPEFQLVTSDHVEAYAPYVESIVEVPGGHGIFRTAFDETASAVERFLEA
ncbi:alpha/beta fold hydrolase [Rhodococcus koreensis]